MVKGSPPAVKVNESPMLDPTPISVAGIPPIAALEESRTQASYSATGPMPLWVTHIWQVPPAYMSLWSLTATPLGAVQQLFGLLGLLGVSFMMSFVPS